MTKQVEGNFTDTGMLWFLKTVMSLISPILSDVLLKKTACRYMTISCNIQLRVARQVLDVVFPVIFVSLRSSRYTKQRAAC